MMRRSKRLSGKHEGKEKEAGQSSEKVARAESLIPDNEDKVPSEPSEKLVGKKGKSKSGKRVKPAADIRAVPESEQVQETKIISKAKYDNNKQSPDGALSVPEVHKEESAGPSKIWPPDKPIEDPLNEPTERTNMGNNKRKHKLPQETGSSGKKAKSDGKPKKDSLPQKNSEQVDRAQPHLNANLPKKMTKEVNEVSSQENVKTEIKSKPDKLIEHTRRLPSSLENESFSANDIQSMLLKFESGIQLRKEGEKMETSGESDDEDDEDWEDVEDHQHTAAGPSTSNVVEVKLESTNIMTKKKKKKFDVKEWFRLLMNRYKRETQMNVHKVHLLCLISLGYKRNNLCNNMLLQACLLSIVPPYFHKVDLEDWDVEKLQMFVKFFRKALIFTTTKSQNQELVPDVEDVCSRLECGHVGSDAEMVTVFVSALRVFRLKTRLVISLQPTTHKASDVKPKNEKKATTGKESKCAKPKVQSTSSTNAKNSSQTTQGKDVSQKAKSAATAKVTSKKKSADAKTEDAQKAGGVHPQSGKQRRRSSVQHSYKEQSGSEGEISDDDFLPIPSFRKPALKKISSGSQSKSVKIVSSDSSEDKTTPSGTNYWAEVYLELDNKWISVDCLNGNVDCAEKMQQLATSVEYVLAYDKDNHIRDVTRRYVTHWLTNHRSVNNDWWEDTLDACGAKEDRLEKCQLDAAHANKPLPTSVAQFKNHPLYALKRHLLKFEAIYPPDAATMGFIRGEAVYPRSCVHTLHSRENWMKEARAVRLGEEPYKLVKARPKPMRRRTEVPSSGEPEMVALFGHWQTEDYIPPPVVDGKIPRNGYGNVELFKESMLPGGAAYLKLSALNKVAKKLAIDCAPAMLGWEHHCGHAVPILEGWIVPEEMKDVLIAAWHEEQEIQAEKEAEKREKRVMDNWKKLIKGLLAKEKIIQKYGKKKPAAASETCEQDEGGKLSVEKPAKKGKEKKSVTPAIPVDTAWPQNKQGATTSSGSTAHAFPFEVHVEEL